MELAKFPHYKCYDITFEVTNLEKKGIIIDKEIIITDSADSPRIIIKKSDVFSGKLNFKINGGVEINKILSFES